MNTHLLASLAQVDHLGHSPTPWENVLTEGIYNVMCYDWVLSLNVIIAFLLQHSGVIDLNNPNLYLILPSRVRWWVWWSSGVSSTHSLPCWLCRLTFSQPAFNLEEVRGLLTNSQFSSHTSYSALTCQLTTGLRSYTYSHTNCTHYRYWILQCILYIDHQIPYSLLSSE